MRNSLHAGFGIIINDAQHCRVWPVHQAAPPGWRFTARRGSKAAMQACIDQQFVPTAPALPPELDSRYLGAQWAAAEFDD
jgi:uncharacterized protein YbdZ (MbtH family)